MFFLFYSGLNGFDGCFSFNNELHEFHKILVLFVMFVVTFSFLHPFNPSNPMFFNFTTENTNCHKKIKVTIFCVLLHFLLFLDYLFLRFALRLSCRVCRTNGVMVNVADPSGMMQRTIRFILPSRKSSISFNTARQISSCDFFSPVCCLYRQRIYSKLMVTMYCLFICVFIVLYIFINTLFLSNLLHFLILLAQSLQVLQYK